VYAASQSLLPQEQPNSQLKCSVSAADAASFCPKRVCAGSQVGYVAGGTKRAYLMASGSETGATFSVKNSYERWNLHN
jgi:hypothetical protein